MTSPFKNYQCPAAREIRANEKLLNKIQTAARMALKPDAIALACGLTPYEFGVLCANDPDIALLVAQARAEGELAIATVLYDAAVGGSESAALKILEKRHGWATPKEEAETDAARARATIDVKKLPQADLELLERLLISATPDEVVVN